MTDPVIIAGFHRSGTSAVARTVHAAGLDLGADLLGADSANPYGHFEDQAVIEMHDTILESGGLTWKSTERLGDRTHALPEISKYVTKRQQATSQPWGLKDPRVSLFLDEWLTMAPDAQLLFVIRPPGPAVASLHRRHIRRFIDTAGIDPSDLAFRRDPDLGLKLWCHYHEQALPALTRHSATTVVNYARPDQLDETLHGLCVELGLTPDPHVRLDATLGQRETTWIHDPLLHDRVRSLWSELTALIN